MSGRRAVADPEEARRQGEDRSARRRRARAACCAPAISPRVYVPSVEDEAIRDLCRARDAARVTRQGREAAAESVPAAARPALRRARDWNDAHRRYLAKVVCPTPAQQIVFQESVRAVDEQVDRLQRLEAELLERAPAWRLYPVVQALQALRGVQWLVAITVVAELGDLTRFDNPAATGRVRRPHPVGVLQWRVAAPGRDHQSRQRPRAARVDRSRVGVSPSREGLGAHPARASIALPKPIQDLGWKAQVRLCKRFRRLVARGKHPNVAVTAIARELIAFMWAIAKEVPLPA